MAGALFVFSAVMFQSRELAVQREELVLQREELGLARGVHEQQAEQLTEQTKIARQRAITSQIIELSGFKMTLELRAEEYEGKGGTFSKGRAADLRRSASACKELIAGLTGHVALDDGDHGHWKRLGGDD